jgi:peptidoglycan/xylan/chitin deacetylase (PgdA/CDA1 family)
VLVERVEQHPDLTRRVIDEGHEVALHAMSHRLLGHERPRERARLILEAKHRLESATGTRVRTFRPPYGRLDPVSFALARAARLQVVAWSAQVDDWLHQPCDAIVERFLGVLQPGAIVLVHDGLVTGPLDPPSPTASERATWLPAAIERASAAGFDSRSVEEMLRDWPAERFPWFSRREP